MISFTTPFDTVLALSLCVIAWRALASDDHYKALVLFVAFGLLLALAWVRLEAPDIALAEAAIGAGLTGALLFDAIRHLQGRVPAGGDAPAVRMVIGLLATGLAALTVWMIAELPRPSTRVPSLVAGHLESSGITHAVTAVLLNFRGYDTLLEVGVLLLAVLGVLALRQGAADSDHSPIPAGVVLRAFAGLLVPLMVLVAGYLLWTGEHRAGGAFQAGAVLAAAGVLLRLAGRLPVLLPPRFWLRAGLLAGFALFLVIALGAVIGGHALLEYPAGLAGMLIVLIESVLTVSIGLILVILFVGAPNAADENEGRGQQE